MKLTGETKKYIDSLDYEQLLRTWRFAPTGDLWMQGETGQYWSVRMIERRTKNPEGAVVASKRVGYYS